MISINQSIEDALKGYSKAKIYFHKDLDGLCSAICFKEFIFNRYGIVTTSAETIQYGSEEYSVKPPKDDEIPILVDFSHGKPMIKIWTDHHDGQVGVDDGQSTHFASTPSNTQYISETISPTSIFSDEDIKIISMIDVAGFATYGLKPDDIINSVFTWDFSLSNEANNIIRGLAANKLLLSYKNKEDFMSKIVLLARPSLASIYSNILKIVAEERYIAPVEVSRNSENYYQQRVSKKSNVSISNLKNGGSCMIGSTVIQNGGGFMGRGNQYDRYTIFKVWPNCHYLLTMWPMGLVQLSKNPFIPLENMTHLGDLAAKVLRDFESDLKEEVITLDRLKYEFERDVIKKGITDAVGFCWHDYEALYKDKMRGVSSSNKWWTNMIMDISDKPYKWLSNKQKAILKRVTVSAWDVIKASSGGHKDITNLSGLVFLQDTKGFMLQFSMALVDKMKDKRLGEVNVE